MFKKALIFGLLASVVIVGFGLFGYRMTQDSSDVKLWEILGYLGMILGFSLIFVAIKTYKEKELGGVIRFSTAFRLGILITLVASVVYIVTWEIQLSDSRDDFIDTYQASIMEEFKQSGATEEEIAQKQTELSEFKELYKNPFFRLVISLMEIFPVGLLISLLSAALLRNKSSG
ncbi:DUF4199 domain-containing protein [Marinicella sp. W31]|uniref:DUF4199 domain-containing protein n=1 Tax=Marinicella sp. W31 TaxID=3023713 RepID=UPI0037568003